MLVYRIAAARYVRDLSGAGARLTGGRWNDKGTPVVYTSESISLATVEYLVHVPMSLAPAGLMLATLSIPDDIAPLAIKPGDLPRGWKEYPAPAVLAGIGGRWLADGEGLLLRVPSAVIEQEFNVLINPLHPDMRRVVVSAVGEFRLDERLARRKAGAGGEEGVRLGCSGEGHSGALIVAIQSVL